MTEESQVDTADEQETEPAVTAGPEQLLDQQRLGKWSAGCRDIPDGFLIPFGWKCALSGIHKVVERSKDTVEVRVAYGPILPVASYLATDGNQFIELVWWDGLRWLKQMVPRSVAKSGKRLVLLLGDAGFPATESAGRDIEQWLASTESLNRHVLPDHTIARWLGWQPDGSFVASPDDFRVEVVYPEQRAAAAAHRERGTLTAWQEGVQLIERLPVAKMALYAGLAACLLETLGLPSFTVDISGPSTRGKSTAAKIGLSCWADPTADGGGVYSWRTTMLSAEKRLNLVRGLPVLFDETRVATNPDIINDLLYQVAQGQGKGRNEPWPSELKWQTIVLSTGEQPALSFTTNQGASARVLTIARPPFGAAEQANADIAASVSAATDANYGHAGPLFVERLREHLARSGARSALVKRHARIAERVRGANELSARRSPLVAALVLAAQLAEEWGVTPKGLTVPATRVWLDIFTTEEATDDRPEMALRAVQEFIAANWAAIWYPRCLRKQPPSGWIGRTVVMDDKTAVALLPVNLKAALDRHGIALDTVIEAWKERGWLVKSGTKGRPYEHKIRLGAPNAWHLVFNPDVVSGDFVSDPDPAPRDGYLPYADAR